ncbi:MAG: Crp/Fnr family transcriptional regulator [Myxococcota bacterium]|nr:Crp/Fnr family transcriptional regulator [Myxococcota bacterium]
MRTKINATDLFKNVSIFRDLQDAELLELTAVVQTLRLKKDTLVFRQHDQGDSLYVVAEGRVKVTVQTEESDREMILTIFKLGDFFGEMSLIDGQPRSATIETMEKTILLQLRRTDFIAHLKKHPMTSLNIITEMSARLRRSSEIIGNLGLLDVYSRLARVLIEMAKTDGVEQEDTTILIPKRPTQQDLASMIGTSRETVSRVLSEFQRRGLLTTEGKSILLSHGFIAEKLWDQHS